MNVNLDKILNVSILNNDVDNFVGLLSNIQKSISDHRKKPGFKNKNKFTVELEENQVDCLNKFLETIENK